MNSNSDAVETCASPTGGSTEESNAIRTGAPVGVEK